MFGFKKKVKRPELTLVKNVNNTANVPSHIAFICDGNRRWATMRGLAAMEGHRRGAEFVDDVARHLLKRGITTITFFIFSTENWNRGEAEVKFLMDFVLREMPKRKKLAMKENVRIKFIGRKTKLSPAVLKMCEKMELDTAENINGTIAFAFDYGGQDEIVRAAQSAIASGIDAADLDIETFETFLDSGELLPIDLMIRTSGESRISNFMLWKLAYAELMFVNEHWPEMTSDVIDRVLNEYTKRKRHFGGGKIKNYTGKKGIK